jgi:hypothetical protein
MDTQTLGLFSIDEKVQFPLKLELQTGTPLSGILILCIDSKMV